MDCITPHCVCRVAALCRNLGDAEGIQDIRDRGDPRNVPSHVLHSATGPRYRVFLHFTSAIRTHARCAILREKERERERETAYEEALARYRAPAEVPAGGRNASRDLIICNNLSPQTRLTRFGRNCNSLRPSRSGCAKYVQKHRDEISIQHASSRDASTRELALRRGRRGRSICISARRRDCIQIGADPRKTARNAGDRALITKANNCFTRAEPACGFSTVQQLSFALRACITTHTRARACMHASWQSLTV